VPLHPLAQAAVGIDVARRADLHIVTPHAAAQRLACGTAPKGSSELATRVLGNANGCSGTGENPRASGGKRALAGSGTTTSNAPLIGTVERLAQCATRRQARLWATSTGGEGQAVTASSRARSQSAHNGRSHSR
jgi:hypothetical protein